MSATTLQLALAGETVILDAARALYWPARETPVVADVHFGKAHVLRSAGVAIPRGSTSSDLAALDAALARHGARRMIVLGDLVHGRTRSDAPWAQAVRAWRAANPVLEAVVVKGNHDRHFDPRSLGFDVAIEPVREGPFAFVHHPGSIDGAYSLGGHVHPGIELHDAHARMLRLPVFRFALDHGVLPAFGRLTGLMTEPPRAGERIVAIARDELFELGARG